MRLSATIGVGAFYADDFPDLAEYFFSQISNAFMLAAVPTAVSPEI